MSKSLAETLKRLKELKMSDDFKDIENYLMHKAGSNYFLNDVVDEGRLNHPDLEFKKYILKSFDSDFINPNNLESDKTLYLELKDIFNNFLGDDFILIMFFENNNSRSWNSNEMELFNIIFKKTFFTGKSGHIKVSKLDDCKKSIAFGDSHNISEGSVSIHLNCVYEDYFTYVGNSFKNENVLFYGFNIEENPYLIKLFQNNPPKKLLNLVPVGNRNSFLLDNVD